MYCELYKQVHVNSGFFLVTSLFLRGYGGCVQLITYWNKNMLHIRKFYFKEISRCHNAMNPKISDFYVFFLSWICLWFQTISSSTPISELTSRQPPLPHLPPAPNAKNYRKILCRHLLQKLPDLGKTWVTPTHCSCTESHYLPLTICICL